MLEIGQFSEACMSGSMYSSTRRARKGQILKRQLREDIFFKSAVSPFMMLGLEASFLSPHITGWRREGNR